MCYTNRTVVSKKNRGKLIKMIIFLSELQKEHLSLLHEHSTQVLIDFCKLAIDYLSNGVNAKKYLIAAEKLNVCVEDVTNLVYALIYLIVEGSKHNLSEADFKSSLALAGFPEDKQEVLVRLHSAKRAELSEALCLLQQKDPTYQDFRWRFEVQLSSRIYNDLIKPMITITFVIMKPKNYGQNGEDKSRQIEECASAVRVNNSIQDAKAASHGLNVIEHVLLECDLPNLLHLTNKLEQALKESKSQHVRKVQRVL